MAKHVVLYKPHDPDAFTAAWIHRKLEATPAAETDYATWAQPADVNLASWIESYHPMAHLWVYGFPTGDATWSLSDYSMPRVEKMDILRDVVLDITEFTDRDDGPVPQRSLARQALDRWNVDGDPNVTSWLVDYAEDMVLDRDQLPHALDHQACMCAADLTFSNWDELDAMPEHDRQVSGHMVRETWDRIANDTISRGWDWIHLNGSNIPVVNHPVSDSLASRCIADRVLDRMINMLSMYDGAAVFHIDHNGGVLSFTLRRNKRSALERVQGLKEMVLLNGTDSQATFTVKVENLYGSFGGHRRSYEAVNPKENKVA